MKNNRWGKGAAVIFAALLALTFFPRVSMGEAADQVWELVTEDGTRLTSICVQPETGDQYVSGDNKLYEVIRVDGATATLAAKGDFELPDVSWLDAEAALPVSADASNKLIALYCTHSDESYKPSDGTYSDDKRGSIYEVAAALASSLRDAGAQTKVSDALHYPHDAGAYRRSRQTAIQLLKSTPDAMFDIHRDGIPDPEEYAVTIGGKKVSKIRILVGRGNQNMEVNKKFASQVKAVADKVYPKLIKDIYMGKGTYNQDLLPHSLLFECGTYTLSKDRVLASMPMLAGAVYKSLYGGVVGSAGASDVKSGSESPSGGVTQGATDAPAAEDSGGVGTGILWVVGIFVVGLIVYAVVATGSFKGAMHKAGRNISEMTGGLVGKKPDDHEPPSP